MAETLKFAGSEEWKKEGGGRGEIDTSAPFESVKEAASRFGESGSGNPVIASSLKLSCDFASKTGDLSYGAMDLVRGFISLAKYINTSMIEGALMKVGKLSGIYHLENIFNWMNLAQLHVVRNFHGDDSLMHALISIMSVICFSIRLRGIEEVDIAQVEEHAAQLEKDLILKERETLDVLKELEATKMIVEELKLKLQKESSEVTAILETNSDDRIVTPIVQEAEMKRHENPEADQQHLAGGLMLCPSSAPGLILMELKQAKLNLTRTTNDLADIRASVESFNKKIEKERISLEKTRERLTLNSSKISSLEAELNQTRLKVQLAKDAEIKGSFDNPMDIARELQKLTSEAEDFKKMGEAAKSEVLKAISEIEQTKARIKTAEIRLVAAKKMKEAARAAEVIALAEIKALSNSESSHGVLLQKPDGVTLSFEEYSALTCRAREAEELSKGKVIDAMLQVDEANISKVEILRRVEEATEEIKTSKKALEEALNRVETANRGKLAVEEALRKWRSEHGQRRRSVQNSTKFKNSYPSHHRRDSRMLDVNGLNLEASMPDEFEPGIHKDKSTVKQKMSLGQMLNKQGVDLPSHWKAERESVPKQFPAKRKKFGFGRFSLLLTKQSLYASTETAHIEYHSVGERMLEKLLDVGFI
ncbi:WEB family protein [Vitis vinifera]|uniref:WEB family protein n=1 Tax=Vitis vinifera TaxID=29760 RepID=A0A438E0E9_VITVI|nr:WEB family protein [Vitis vinifera]